MPDLNTTLHLDMLRRWRKKRSLLGRILRAVKRELQSPDLYGLDWGDPDKVEPLAFVRDRYLTPYVNAQHACLEIGPGGGRWTRYLLPFKTLYVVDYHEESLRELTRNFRAPHMRFIRNSGADFPTVPDHSIDFLFSFGTFVHLDLPLIDAYLRNMSRILKPGANVVIHYSDKTKLMGQANSGFSDNDPPRMRQRVASHGYTILEEDLTTMWHSSIIRFATEAPEG